MAVQLELSITHRSPDTVLKLTGELDLATAGLVGGALRDLVQSGHTRLVVDTSALRFCDLTGLDVFLAGRADAESAGGSLRLVGVHGILARVLEVTRLRHLFQADGTADFQRDDAAELLPV